MSLIETTTAKERAAIKRRNIIAKSGNVKGLKNEPTINPLNYQIDLINALNYYNFSYDDNEKQKWVIDYCNIKSLSSIPDYEFHSLGALVRLKTRDQYLDDKELNFIDSKIQELSERKKKSESKSISPKISVSEKINSTVIIHVAEFDGMVDDFITHGTIPDFEGYIKNKELTPNIIKSIPKYFESTIEEIKQVLDGNEELVEGYSNFGKVKLRKLLKIYESISDVCGLQAKVVKVTRKPRIQKEKPPSEIVKKVIALKEYKELDLKSEPFIKLINASEVRVYNVKYKRLMVYKAIDNSKITVKNSSLVGWDVNNSVFKTIRKPELTLKALVALGKREFSKAFKEIKSKEQSVNGRLNADCIVLKIIP